jgi:hypothetical protein
MGLQGACKGHPIGINRRYGEANTGHCPRTASNKGLHTIPRMASLRIVKGCFLVISWPR